MMRRFAAIVIYEVESCLLACRRIRKVHGQKPADCRVGIDIVVMLEPCEAQLDPNACKTVDILFERFQECRSRLCAIT